MRAKCGAGFFVYKPASWWWDFIYPFEKTLQKKNDDPFHLKQSFSSPFAPCSHSTIACGTSVVYDPIPFIESRLKNTNKWFVAASLSAA